MTAAACKLWFIEVRFNKNYFKKIIAYNISFSAFRRPYFSSFDRL